MEIENLVAECELNPARLRVYMAELIRLRTFAEFSHQFRGRLPLKVRDAFERNVPARSQQAEWARAAATGLIDQPAEPVQEALF